MEDVAIEIPPLKKGWDVVFQGAPSTQMDILPFMVRIRYALPVDYFSKGENGEATAVIKKTKIKSL